MSTLDAVEEKALADFLKGKSAIALELFAHFVKEFQAVGTDIRLSPAKTMIGVASPRKRIAYITQVGKNFVHAVFLFGQPFHDNLCFQKIAEVPGQKQFNHHFRMLAKDDVNDEIKGFMKLAYELSL